MSIEIKVASNIADRPDIAALVHKANPTVERIVRESRYPVRARWDVDSDTTGRERLMLSLGDFSGDVTETYSRDELNKPDELWPRVHWQWGDLLQKRVQRLAKEVQNAVDAME